MMRLLKIAFFALFYSLFVLLTGCYDANQPAPVIDAWYQKGAASNFYVVRSSDTVYSIAFAFGLDYRDLVAANQLTPPYSLSPGQRLKMTHRPPGQSSPSQPAPPIVRTSVVQPSSRVIVWHHPAAGRLLARFSRRPDGHPGISIGGKWGEPVRAAADGVVVYSGDGVRGYGNLIIVKHNNSYLSAYAFNQRNLVMVGDHVRAGMVIARMGQNDAGRTLLYFEIRRNGVPVNPLLFL